MGLLNQILRGAKGFLKSLRKKISGRGRGKRKSEENSVVPRSWRKPQLKPGEKRKKDLDFVKTTSKKRIPGLLFFKRVVAGILLLVNFVLSQFLLGSLGETGQPMFILFLLNSWFLAEYLWKTRRKSD